MDLHPAGLTALQPWIQAGSTAAVSIAHQAITAALLNLSQQQLAGNSVSQQQQQQQQQQPKQQQQQRHLPLPVCLSSAAAAVLAGEVDSRPGSSSNSSSSRLQGEGGIVWEAAAVHSAAGKPVWLSLAQVLVQCLGSLATAAAAAAAAAAACVPHSAAPSDKSGTGPDVAAAAAAGGGSCVSSGLQEMQGCDVEALAGALLGTLAATCSGE
jgi:hypothetical protein